MTRYVKNPDGVIHSVPDDFVPMSDGWEDADAADATPELRGEAVDPAVAAVYLRDGSGVAADTPKTVIVGHSDSRKIEPSGGDNA